MLTVRPAGPADAPEICALRNAVDLLEIGRPDTDLHEVEADLLHPEQDLANDSWLAFEDGRLVSYAILWCDGDPERIDSDHYVLPEHHGKGIGSQLMDAVVQRALEAGHTRITVAYPDGNSYAERFHRAHGFIETHREPSGSGLPDTIWMVRELGSADGASGEASGHEAGGPAGESP